MPTRSLDEAARELGRVLPKLLRLHLDNWWKLKGNDGPPEIADLFSESDPVTQPWLVVIDAERDDVQKIRLVGTRIADFSGSMGLDTISFNRSRPI